MRKTFALSAICLLALAIGALAGPVRPTAELETVQRIDDSTKSVVYIYSGFITDQGQPFAGEAMARPDPQIQREAEPISVTIESDGFFEFTCQAATADLIIPYGEIVLAKEITFGNGQIMSRIELQDLLAIHPLANPSTNSTTRGYSGTCGSNSVCYWSCGPCYHWWWKYYCTRCYFRYHYGKVEYQTLYGWNRCP